MAVIDWKSFLFPEHLHRQERFCFLTNKPRTEIREILIEHTHPRVAFFIPFATPRRRPALFGKVKNRSFNLELFKDMQTRNNQTHYIVPKIKGNVREIGNNSCEVCYEVKFGWEIKIMPIIVSLASLYVLSYGAIYYGRSLNWSVIADAILFEPWKDKLSSTLLLFPALIWFFVGISLPFGSRSQGRIEYERSRHFLKELMIEHGITVTSKSATE